MPPNTGERRRRSPRGWSSAIPDEIVTAIVEVHTAFTPGMARLLFLDPTRVLPPEDSGAGGGEEVTVGYANGTFFAVTGHAAIRAAALDGVLLLRARLSPEFDRTG